MPNQLHWIAAVILLSAINRLAMAADEIESEDYDVQNEKKYETLPYTLREFEYDRDRASTYFGSLARNDAVMDIHGGCYYNSIVYDDFCYKFMPVELTFFEYSALCDDMGGQLAPITSHFLRNVLI